MKYFFTHLVFFGPPLTPPGSIWDFLEVPWDHLRYILGVPRAYVGIILRVLGAPSERLGQKNNDVNQIKASYI